MQGIVPASKGFDAVQFTRFCEDLRLVNQFQLVIANRFGKMTPSVSASRCAVRTAKHAIR